ncbi:MAG TPA: transglutaminase-like domain-containing protein [Actinomycetota bacterium]|nr:transglutaminase-like domain-containing protein [Actinomycetota bacterium]
MDAIDRFTEIIRSDDFRVAEAFLAFARLAHPDLDAEPYIDVLDDLGMRVQPAVESEQTQTKKLATLGAFLTEAGFRGNHDDYPDPRNSYLNEVIDRRLGIPISLSVVWIECGIRAGIEMAGIGMPMHFLVGVEGTDLLADPFDGGRLLSRSEAQAIFENRTGGRIEWRDDYLRATTPLQMVRRALSNLKAVYAASSGMQQLLAVENYLLAMPDAPLEELKERATLLSALGRYPQAIADLRTYLEDGPDDADQVEREIRRLQASMN